MRVTLVGDWPLVRSGFRQVLQSAGIGVIASVADAADAANVLRRVGADAVVVSALTWQAGVTSTRELVALDLNGRMVRGARIVIGYVAPVPWRVEAAERVLAGKSITEQTAMEAADAAVQGAKAMSQNAYKIQVARTAVKRAIMMAAGLKGNWA